MSDDSAIAIDDEPVASPAQRSDTADSTDVADVADVADAVDDALACLSHVALPEGVSQLDFDAMLAIGREKGQLTQDELIESLHTVELTPEVLTVLIDRVTAAGVLLVEDEEDVITVEVTVRKEMRPARQAGESKTET